MPPATRASTRPTTSVHFATALSRRPTPPALPPDLPPDVPDDLLAPPPDDFRGGVPCALTEPLPPGWAPRGRVGHGHEEYGVRLSGRVEPGPTPPPGAPGARFDISLRYV